MNTIKVLKLGVMLFLITSTSSCATSQLDLAPRLENRTLRISPDFAGFEYQYEVCVRDLLFICMKKQMKKDTYDLTKPEVRKQLIDMGFVGKVRENP